jgi:hypothetical protein
MGVFAIPRNDALSNCFHGSVDGLNRSLSGSEVKSSNAIDMFNLGHNHSTR